MSRIGLIGAMASEVALFRDRFGAKQTGIPGIWTGTYPPHELFICECGIGKVNAAAMTQRLIDLFEIEALINTGVAGAVSAELSTCDVAISERLTYHDFFPLEALEQTPPFQSVFLADQTLLRAATLACESLAAGGAFRYRVGMIVSGDRFVNDSGYTRRLREEFDALCTEMEGAAIAHTAAISGIPFVVIRAVSDFADEQGEASFEEFAGIAAQRAGSIVAEMLPHI